MINPILIKDLHKRDYMLHRIGTVTYYNQILKTFYINDLVRHGFNTEYLYLFNGYKYIADNK